MSERTCLVVDDEPSMRAYLREVLQQDRFNVLEAETAPEAYRMVQELRGAVDLIVTDIRMPGEMDGVDLAYAVGNAFAQIPLILISGFGDNRTRPAIANCEFLCKPFLPDAILAAAGRLTARAQSASSAS